MAPTSPLRNGSAVEAKIRARSRQPRPRHILRANASAVCKRARRTAKVIPNSKRDEAAW